MLCRSVAAFHHVLLVRISQLLITQLQILLDPACEPAVQASVLRIVLRVTRTTLQQFHRQLGPKSGVLLEGLLAGGPRLRSHGKVLGPLEWVACFVVLARGAQLRRRAVCACFQGPCIVEP